MGNADRDDPGDRRPASSTRSASGSAGRRPRRVLVRAPGEIGRAGARAVRPRGAGRLLAERVRQVGRHGQRRCPSTSAPPPFPATSSGTRPCSKATSRIDPEAQGRGRRRPVHHGSGEFAYALAERGLVDDFEVYLNPLVWGEGNVHVLGDRGTVRLELDDIKRFDSGVVLLTSCRACLGTQSGRRDSNPLPRAWEARALPGELHPQVAARCIVPAPDANRPRPLAGAGARRPAIW